MALYVKRLKGKDFEKKDLKREDTNLKIDFNFVLQISDF